MYAAFVAPKVLYLYEANVVIKLIIGMWSYRRFTSCFLRNGEESFGFNDQICCSNALRFDRSGYESCCEKLV